MREEAAEHGSKAAGILLTVALHACLLSLVSFTGFKYIYPPPPESTFLLDFEQVAPEQMAPEQVEEDSAENLTTATAQDRFGDVETPSKPEQPALDPRASFPGMTKKDTSLTASQAAQEASDNLKEGQAKGNTNTGRPDGKPNAHVKGRNTVGNIPQPMYNVQESGTVVVNIWVDNYGNVAKAVPGGDGTTVTDKSLWAAARKAALETHFNMSSDAPAMQEGTITYIFNLK